MLKRSIIICILFAATSVLAQSNRAIGQTLQISTHFKSFVGRPAWLLIIRDVDRGENKPYLFDINKEDNYWLVLTHSKNYIILASEMQFAPYKKNSCCQKIIRNFCNLESNGRIHRGTSFSIDIGGKLTPNTNTFRCHVIKYPETNFTIVTPDSE